MRFQSAAVIAVALLNSGAVGATILADLHKERIDQRKLIRKENGQLEDQSNVKSSQELKVAKDHHRQSPSSHGDPLRAPDSVWPVQKMSSHYCDDVFPIGLNNTATCKQSNATWESILSEAMCKEAAESNEVSQLQHIGIHVDEENYRPRGCFKWPCETEDKTGTCYYYNDKGNIPEHPSGEAVCVEYKYTKGTAVTSATTYTPGQVPFTAGVTCVNGYEPINDEELCDRASQCLGRCEGTHFVMAINNFSAYHDYPMGCFIHAGKVNGDGENCVFYNPQRNVSKTPMFPVGTPICHITSRADQAHLLIAAEANNLCTLDDATPYNTANCPATTTGIKPAECSLSCASGYSHLHGADPKVRCYKDGETFTITNPCTADSR